MILKINNAYDFFSKIELEAYMWAIALIYLFFINPYEAQHFSLCIFKNLGINFCPGCGIGRSISMIYHGDFLYSLQTHPLGLTALIIIVCRIYSLIRKSINQSQLI